MLVIICITLLAYIIMGKDISQLTEKLKSVDWKSKIASLWEYVKEYGLKAGRATCQKVLQLYYVLKEGETTTMEKAMIFGALAYTVLPVSLLPKSVFGFLGILDEVGALLFVYKKLQSKITPDINLKVDETLDQWFGCADRRTSEKSETDTISLI